MQMRDAATTDYRLSMSQLLVHIVSSDLLHQTQMCYLWSILIPKKSLGVSQSLAKLL